MRVLRRSLIVLWILGLLGVAGFYQLQEQALLAPMPLQSPQRFDIPPGSTVSWVAGELANRKLLESPAFLVWYARLGEKASQLKVGHYQLTPGMSVWQALLRFNRGEVIRQTFTIVEGRRFSDLMAALRKSGVVTWTLDGLSNSEIMSALGRPGLNPEGMFYADTYFFPDGTTDRQFLLRAIHSLEQKLTKIWADRRPELPLKDSYHALILASIIEKETAAADERARIAGVFIRRLRKGMRLQTDPTVIYGLGDKFDGNLRRRDLRADTPYNTYTRSGLPPTPIAMVGQAAIEAAVHPTDEETLYFVSMGNGRHFFSKTYADHQQAVNQYQRRRRRKGSSQN